MKPPSRFHRSLFFSNFSIDLSPDLARNALTRPYSSSISNHPTGFNRPHKFIPSSIRCLGQSKVLPNWVSDQTTSTGVSVRELSTSVETNTSDKSFERIHVQTGLNSNPLVIERIHKDEGESVSRNEIEKSEGKIVETLGGKVREESEAEKEAWRILEDAVVRYCGSPVGTVAANDPGDKMPLNYDQVFIRDFVPSALAFLLKGEGDIVRNFLLHTLQLQVCRNVSFIF